MNCPNYHRRCAAEWGAGNVDCWCRPCLEWMVEELGDTYETLTLDLEDAVEDRHLAMNEARDAERDLITDYLDDRADQLDKDFVGDEDQLHTPHIAKALRAETELIENLKHLDKVVPFKKKEEV